MEKLTQNELIDWLSKSMPWIGTVNQLVNEVCADSKTGFAKYTVELTANNGTLTNIDFIKGRQERYKRHPQEKPKQSFTKQEIDNRIGFGI